jgi:outer membrane immunogenic protein
MQRPLLVACGVLTLCSACGVAARAADLPPAPLQPAWSWNGFYLGGHAGYAWVHDPAQIPLFTGLSTPSVGDIESQGALAGFQAGANWQSGRWLAGLELDMSTTAARGSSSASGTGPFGGGTGFMSRSLDDRVEMLGSSRVRLGYLPRPDLLLYATGGLAWTLIEQSAELSAVQAPNSESARQTVSDWRFGWVAGAGAEMRLANTDWLARLEYLHYDFGDALVGRSISVNGGVVTTSSAFVGPLTLDVVRAGLSYRFGAPPAAASARSGPYAWAPPAAPSTLPWSWTGLYVGAHAGYGWWRDPGNELTGGGVIGDITGQGGLGGFQAGANWQRGALVGGLEIDLSATNIRGQNGSTAPVAGGGSETDTSGEHVRLLGSARARLGYLVWPSTLLYATGGLAWNQINGLSGFSLSTVPGSFDANTSSSPAWLFGWVAGLGAEQRIGSTNWIARLEYLHYDFGEHGSAFNSATTGGVTTVTPLLTSSHMTADVVRAGASYRLGSDGGAAPAQFVKAPPAPAGWNGFYLGLHGGGGFGNDPFREAGLVVPVPDVRASGWLAGGQAGANWQTGRWLAGMEIDVSTTGILGSSTATAVIMTVPSSQIMSDKLELLGSARTRLGWLARPNLLVYGSGGVAWTQLMHGDVGETFSGGIASVSATFRESWRWGWAAGLGAEMRIGDGNWLGRVEYLHYDFGKTSDLNVVINGITAVQTEGRLTADIIRAGVSYQLN